MKLFLLFLLLPILSISQEKNTTDNIIGVAEISPEFVGGEEAMNKFIVDNIIYPAESIKKGEQGIVYVQFVVRKTGELTDLKVLKGETKLLDQAALDVISKMPKWIPGKQAGKIVNVSFVLPINFRITDDNKPAHLLTKKEKRALKKQERRNKKRK